MSEKHILLAMGTLLIQLVAQTMAFVVSKKNYIQNAYIGLMPLRGT